jgi:prolyl-tRNA editing enzyme YbaK/EbsC (Cys-tRNA(Pro) deacylase)
MDEKTLLEEKARGIAARFGISYQVLYHEADGSTSSAAQAALPEGSGCVIKFLLLEGDHGSTVVGAILRGESRLDVRSLVRVSGVKSPRFASPEVIRRVTGFDAGGVPPFAIANCDVKVMSRTLLAYRYVVGAGGHPHCGARLVPADLLRIPGLLIEDIADDEVSRP